MSRLAPASLGFTDYVDKRDYVGALAALAVDDAVTPVNKLLWTGGRYERSEEAYLELLHGDRDDADVPLITSLYLAIVYLHMGRFTEAEETALTFEPSSEFETGLKSRILLQTALKTCDETKLADYRQLLSDSVEDKLSIAAVEYSARHRFQEAVDIFRDLLANDTDALALYVYTAMSLFQRGDYEQSLEALDVAAESHPDSPIVANLKACNFFHLQDGKAALDALAALCDSKTREAHDLVRHNTVVFNSGEKALQVWPKLVDRTEEMGVGESKLVSPQELAPQEGMRVEVTTKRIKGRAGTITGIVEEEEGAFELTIRFDVADDDDDSEGSALYPGEATLVLDKDGAPVFAKASESIKDDSSVAEVGGGDDEDDLDVVNQSLAATNISNSDDGAQKELCWFDHEALEPTKAKWLAKRGEIAVELAAISDEEMKGKSEEVITANREVVWAKFTAGEGKEGTEAMQRAYDEAMREAATGVVEFAKAMANGNAWTEEFLTLGILEKWRLALPTTEEAPVGEPSTDSLPVAGAPASTGIQLDA